MSSFDAVNYSLRPNKTIQRSLVFDGLIKLSAQMPWADAAYIGFGSIWFTDFVMAHKRLGLRELYSIESNDIGFRRAEYNQPFRNVQVLHGLSFEVIPEFYDDPAMSNRPWIVWLDYDLALSDDAVEEMRGLVERAPANSVVLATVNTGRKHYGEDFDQRGERLRILLGDVVPERISKEILKDEDRTTAYIAQLLEDFLVSVARNCARPGGGVPAFRLPYRDKAPMATVGIVLPQPELEGFCSATAASPDWLGLAEFPIVAPHLTLKELAVLQAQMPAQEPLNRAAVQALGFDLGDDQIAVFSRYYKYYPAFAQISA